MVKSDEMNVLLVKHLPGSLSEEDYCDLFKQLGGVEVKYCGVHGPLKHSAFVKFPTAAKAKQVLSELHQLELLGKRLCVQYSTNKTVFETNASSDKSPSSAAIKGQSVENEAKVSPAETITDNINAVSGKWSVNYSFNPKLRYNYPAPNTHIIANIAHALSAVPKFYVQVLHLMNRMNLPAPFGDVTPAPPLPEPVSAEPEIEEAEMAVSSSEESELESDEADADKKSAAVTSTATTAAAEAKRQQKKIKRLSRKRARPVFTAPSSTQQVQLKSDMNIEEMFEQPGAKVMKKIEIKQVAVSTQEHANQSTDDMFATDVTMGSTDSGITPAIISEVGGFGKIAPPVRAEADDEAADVDDDDDTEFISSRRLRRGRISSRDMQELSAFRRYEAGEPSSRLYIKNISKQATDKDLRYIFGRYVDWDSDVETNMFDVRLMKEGRMKGQAFVSLASAEKAKLALKETHGYELHDKPIVVTFARSSKPKVPEAKTKK